MSRQTTTLSVLFIDDDPSIHLLVTKILAPIGVGVITAPNVQDGIDKLKTSRVNLILTDIHMDGMDGLSFLSVLKKDKKLNKIPVVVVTGDPDDEKAKLAYDQGAVGFVRKPFVQDEMIHLIRTFSAFGNLYDQEDAGDDFFQRKKLKITTNLAKDSLQRNFDSAITNYLTGLNEIFDFTAIAFYHIDPAGNFELDHEFGSIMFLEDLRIVGPGNSFSVNRLVTSKEDYVSNDTLRSNDPLLRAWANHYSLVSEVMVPFFNVDERSFMTGIAGDRTKLALNGFFWGFRNSIFSTREMDIIKRLSAQANPILNALYNSSRRAK